MLDKTVQVGKNVIIKPQVELHYVTIGDNVKIGKNTTIFGSKDSQVIIEDDVYISPNCYFNGAFGLHIGKEVTFSVGVLIFTDSGPNVGPLTSYFPTQKAKIIIKNGCWIGAGSILLPGTEMEEASILASNSTLKSRVKTYTIFGGNPAKLLKTIKK